MSDSEHTTTAPHTPIRPARQPQETGETPATGDATRNPGTGTTTSTGIPMPHRVPSATATSAEERLRAQLLLANAQISALQTQMATRSTISVNAQPHQSREYWLVPIDKSIKYPGEDSHPAARTVYRQRLRAYLCKSPPIGDLVTGKFPCPISTITDVVPLLRTNFGKNWDFKPKHIKRALAVLQQLDSTMHKRVSDEMDAHSGTQAGSWNQRNTAIYSVICDTLDLSKNGKDLNMLEVIDDNNGLALYNLVAFRLQDVKTTDPLARAIQLKMNLQHIRYIPMPHGVAKYFATIEAHRTDLASLDRPKIIQDWEVVTKALQDLPPLHAQFKEVAHVLSLQRKLFKQETTLPQCREAFINADNENDIHGDLGNNKPGAKKRKLRTNLQRNDKRFRHDNQDKPKHQKGDCGHHPNSVTHCTETCMNPFGIRSLFGTAKTYAEKCAAIRKSLALGWSPRAKNVKVPKGFDDSAAPVTTSATSKDTSTTSALKVNHATSGNTISPNSMRTYQRVQALMTATQMQTTHHTAYAPPMFTTPQLAPAYYPAAQRLTAPMINAPPPVHTYHVAPRYATPPQPMAPPRQMALPPQVAMRTQPQPYYQPKPQQPQLQQPSEDDLIAAGMRYYATQAGRQDFR